MGDKKREAERDNKIEELTKSVTAIVEEMKRIREESEKRNEEFKRNLEAVQAEIRSMIMRYSMSLEDEAKTALE
ncbi:hypothetical protein [Metallosphaera sedula]|uniref:hypothetical protein n=1 Tax=Metallosphaera sedula TaxID=43687 RepID=UPI0020BF3C65|nr:hypothetical protein [Metallosphaera sedula]BBL46950.1 DNA repair ATPase [Metallosphaera sedula]